MSEQKKLFATQPVPAEVQQQQAREAALREGARRPSPMIPGVANPYAVEDGANFYRRLYRPHAKRWVNVSIWIFFILIPALTAVLMLYSLVRGFLG